MSRRKSNRLRMDKDIYLSDTVGRVSAKVLNISNEGAFVKSNRGFHVGGQLSLDFKAALRDRAITLEAKCDVLRVTRQADGFLLGLQFVNKFVTRTLKPVFERPQRVGYKICL